MELLAQRHTRQNTTLFLVALLFALGVWGPSCFAQQRCEFTPTPPTTGSNEGYHCYPIAKVKTRSGNDVTLTSVYVFVDGESPRVYSVIHQEITDISYRHRTTLGPEFAGKDELVALYVGHKPVFFKMISFAATGALEAIQFENHGDVSSKEEIFTFPGEDYGLDEFVFYGKALDQGKLADVSIRGSKIQQITFEQVPQKRPGSVR